MAKKQSARAVAMREFRAEHHAAYGACPVHGVGVGKFAGLRSGLGERRWTCGCVVKEKR